MGKVTARLWDCRGSVGGCHPHGHHWIPPHGGAGLGFVAAIIIIAVAAWDFKTRGGGRDG
ncbi:MAG TPA: hypothetical protein VF506_16475 [Streptosporangiaceae bacterium]